MMRKQYRSFDAIEYAFVCSILASFSVLAVAGLFFGLELNQWSELQGRLVGVTATIAGVAGVLFCVRMALGHLSDHAERK
jgi:LytS/YehU family sensor histidine kinase